MPVKQFGRRMQAVRFCAWTAAALLATVHAWSSRYFVNPDGVSYLDLSDDYLAGRWESAVNGYWSPLYPLLLAGVRKVVAPSAFHEASTVHAFNAVMFLAGLAAFELLLGELRKFQEGARPYEPGITPLLSPGSPAGLACAYSLFFFGGLCLITVRVVTPDMIVAMWAYVIAAGVLRIRRTANRTLPYVALGAVLGAAYLTKAVMFPVGILVLGVSLMVRPRQGSSLPGGLIAVIAFLVVASPQLYAMSRLSGRPSFGEVGRIAYARIVNGYPKFWSGQPPGSGTPLHSIGVLATSPPIYSFPLSEPDRSYPLWDEPAHWYAGMTPHFLIHEQLAATRAALRVYAGVLGKILLPLFLILVAVQKRMNRTTAVLVAIAAVVFGIYGTVHAEPRLIAPWFVIGAVAFLAGAAISSASKRGRAAVACMYGVTAVCWTSIIIQTARSISPGNDEAGMGNAVHSQWLVARKLSGLGVAPGSMVALVGDESDIYWARLADVQVAYQVLLPDSPAYWLLSPDARELLNADLALRGAAAVVASWTSPPPSVTGWIRVSDRHYFILPLKPRDASK